MATDPCFLFRYLIDHSNISTCRSGIAAALDIAAIAWGIAFVIPIIDPDKYSNAAKRLIEEDAHALDLAGKQEDSAVLQFFSVCGVSVRRAETPTQKEGQGACCRSQKAPH